MTADLPNIKTPAAFAEDVENLVWEHDIDYMEAVILYCEKNNIEIETAASMIKLNSDLKEKMQIEAENLNFLPKIERLPI